jgi:hypothetical protein
MDETTYGDETATPCPSCGKPVCLQDWATDGCLNEGEKDQCVRCGAWFVVDSVDYSITVGLRRSEAPTEGPGGKP